MRHYYIDTRTDRTTLWEQIDIRPQAEQDMPSKMPWLLLAHTKDVPERATPHVFEQWHRSYGQVAILYITGGGDPALDIPPERVDPNWSHEFTEAVNAADTWFQVRLRRMLDDWEQTDRRSPPRWQLLKSDWLHDAIDLLTARRLDSGYRALPDPAKRPVFEARLLKAELERLKLTSQENATIQAAVLPNSSPTTLDAALAYLRTRRPGVR
jgi:hypothetical protein